MVARSLALSQSQPMQKTLWLDAAGLENALEGCLTTGLWQTTRPIVDSDLACHGFGEPLKEHIGMLGDPICYLMCRRFRISERVKAVDSDYFVVSDLHQRVFSQPRRRG
jgi:hypothetical protein